MDRGRLARCRMSGVNIVLIAAGISAVIGAGYSIHRLFKSMVHGFSQAVDNSATGHLVRYHLGPNGTTKPMHERVGSIERKQSDHNDVASSIGSRVDGLGLEGTLRHQENTRKLMDISKRLIAVEQAQKTAASVAEDTDARHQGEQT